ncbi:MAG: tetratricopeptide repeat protein [Deltaproteobacteria bacterium]|nr:tetratricopeptide repeat protein [Deltaproteobacteria bacterium]
MNNKGFKRKLSAILSADVAGYSRLMGEDEEATIRTLNKYKKIIFELIERHNGRLVDSPGDNLLAEFASVVDAVKCAIQVQRELGENNEGLPKNRRMDFRIGVNIGDVIQQGGKIYGDGVNVAARIEPLADPGGICVSRTAYDHVKKKLDIEYEYLGEYEVKNIDEPVRIYRVVMQQISDDLLQNEKSIEPTSKKKFRAPDYLARKRRVIYSAIVLFLLLLFGAFPIYQRLTQDLNTELPSKILLAILPFQMINLTGDSIAFAKGLIVTMNAQLTKLTGHHPLQVVSPNEIREKNIQTVEEASSKLGVNLVIEGYLQQFGETMRINYFMVDAKTGEQLRGDMITAEMKNPFNLMDRIVASVLSNLEVDLRPEEEKSIASRTTQQPEAYSYYVTAIGYLQDYHKSENVQTAIRILQHALEKDPKFAEAYAALGESLLLQYKHEKETKYIEEALSACTRALELDSHLASGHVCLGNVFTSVGKYEEAVDEFQRALDLEPSSDEAWRGLGSAYEELGLFNEAEKTYRRAIKLKPGYWAGYSQLGNLYIKQGRFPEAAEQYDRVTQLVPDHHFGYNNLGAVYLYEGRYSEAIPVFQHSVRLRPSEEAYSNLGTTYFYLRRFDEAATEYENGITLNERDWMLWGNLGDAHYWNPKNRARAAEEAYRKALMLGERGLQLNPRNGRLLGWMAYYHAMLDEKEAARDYIKLAIVELPRSPEFFFILAQTYYRLGDTDQTLDWLKKAMSAGLSKETVQNTPLFDPLQDSQEFQDMLSDD